MVVTNRMLYRLNTVQGMLGSLVSSGKDGSIGTAYHLLKEVVDNLNKQKEGANDKGHKNTSVVH